MFDPAGIRFFSESEKYFATLQPNDDYAYIHKAGYRGVLEGVDVNINWHGLRGPEFQNEKPPGKKRILILGDSIVFGWGAPQESIFALALQKLFSRVTPDVEVIPAGVVSWNTRTEYEYLKSAGIHFKPDVVVLVIVSNDVEPKSSGHTDISKDLLLRTLLSENDISVIDHLPPFSISPRPKVWSQAVHYSYLLQYIQYITRTRSTAHWQTITEQNSPIWEDARLALDGIFKLCHENSADFLPYFYGSKSTVMANAVLSRYEKYLQGIGERVFFLPESLFKEAKYRVSRVDPHPNVAGHMIIAQEMFQSLLPTLRDKGKCSTQPSCTLTPQ